MRISQVFRNVSLDYAYLKPEGGEFHWTSQTPPSASLSILFPRMKTKTVYQCIISV